MKFSIVTITYNRAHLIEETIQSVLSQTYGDFEHLVIDDGSTDDTQAVISQLTDSRVKYHRYEKSGIRSFLRNEGIRKAQGEFICILDSDDLWAFDKLEKTVGIFEQNPEIDFMFHNIAFIPEGVVTNNAYPYLSDFKGTIFGDLLDGKILPFPVLTIKRDFLEKIGLMDETMTDGQHDLYFRAAEKGTAFYCFEKLTAMRKHSQNISKNYLMSHYDDYFKTLDKLKSHRAITNARYQRLKSDMHYKIAYIYKGQKQYEAAKKSYWKSFLAKPARYQSLKSLALYVRASLNF